MHHWSTAQLNHTLIHIMHVPDGTADWTLPIPPILAGLILMVASDASYPPPALPVSHNPCPPPLVFCAAERELPIADAPPSEGGIGRFTMDRYSQQRSGANSPGNLSNASSFRRAASLKAAAPSGADSPASSVAGDNYESSQGAGGQDAGRTSLPRLMLMQKQKSIGHLSGLEQQRRPYSASGGVGSSSMRANSSSPETGDEDEDNRFFVRTTANTPRHSRPNSAHASKRPSIAGSMGGGGQGSPRTSITGSAFGGGHTSSPHNLMGSPGLAPGSGGGAAAAGAGWELKPILASKLAERAPRFSAPGSSTNQFPSPHPAASGGHGFDSGSSSLTPSGRDSPLGLGAGGVARQLLGEDRASAPVRRVGKFNSVGPSRLAAEGHSTEGEVVQGGGGDLMGSPRTRPGVRPSTSFHHKSSPGWEGAGSYKPGPGT